ARLPGVVPRVGRRGSARVVSAAGEAALHRILERSSSPLAAREVWRMVGGLRVLDPACGDGSWLMGCLEALVAAGSAALQRLRAWVEDAPQARSGGGGELRRLLQRQRAMASSGNRD